MAFPSQFLAALTDAVALMRVADGYHHDYGPANVARPSEWVLPQASVEYGDGAARGAQRLGAIEINLPVVIRVVCPAPVSPATAQDICDGVIQDFKRLLNALEKLQTLRNAGLIRLEFQTEKNAWRLVAAAPAEVTLTYSLWYRQMKSAL
jgi:hypothetical protein